ncbi:MAG: putative toxin-antitoxin system toxin component, PIN family [Gammaproteobacteria bacterium]|nr:putative toxin-antitoxin system toxin component, PIN family [Gammaproteobacteria bacterium]
MSAKVFIIDTNVLIAGLLSTQENSPTSRILDGMLNGTLIYLLSPDLLREYRAVLLRPKLRALHKLTESEIDQVLTEITANAIWHEPKVQHQQGAPDPGDQHLWNLLASERHAVLVTGDQLLIQHPHPGSSVISPASFIQWEE